MAEHMSPNAGLRMKRGDDARQAFGIDTFVFLLGMAVLLVSAVIWADRGPLTEKRDFSTTYVGAKLVHDGQGGELYNLDEQIKLRNSLYENPDPLIFEHPPFEAILLSPLAAVSYRPAYFIWGVVNVVIWLTIPFLVRPVAPVPSYAIGYLSLWLLFAPIGIGLYNGQTSLILLLMWVFVYRFLKTRRDFAAGLSLGLGLFKFQFVLPFVLILLLKRKWLCVAGFALTTLLLFAISWAGIGWSGLVSYVQLLSNIAAHPENHSYGAPAGMATIEGFIFGVFGASIGARGTLVIVAIISMLLVWFAAKCWKSEETSEVTFDSVFSVSLLVSLLTGFHMFAYDLSPAILPMFFGLKHFPRHGRMLQVALGLTVFLLWNPALFVALSAWRSMYLVVPILLLLIFAEAALVRRYSEESTMLKA